MPPVMMIPADAGALRSAGYEVEIVSVFASSLGVDPIDPDPQKLSAWSPARPEGEGWVLHHKWINDLWDVEAIWVRERGFGT